MIARGGFALLTALWLAAALSAVLLLGAPPIIRSNRASENAALQMRARWAALACLELARADSSYGQSPQRDSTIVGPGAWCRTEPLSVSVLVNPNLTDSVGLYRLLANDVRVASLLDWIDGDDTPRPAGAEADWYGRRGRPVPRNAPLAAVDELTLIRGYGSVPPGALHETFTVRGDGRLSPLRASRSALRTITTLSDELIEQILLNRGTARGVDGAERLVVALRLAPSIDEYREMTSRFDFDDGPTFLRSVGHARSGAVVREVSLLATVRIEVGGMRIRAVEVE